MNKILFAAIFATSTLSLNAQDILVRKGGKEENLKVLEVSPTEVKYKKSNNEDGPVFIEKRSNLYSVKYKNGEVQTFKNNHKPKRKKDKPKPKPTGVIPYYSKYGKEKKFTDEIDLCVGTGWSIGYQVRREFNPYVGWNVCGISYVAVTYDPTDEGMLLYKILGVRGNTPSYKWFRGYADLNIGYSFDYHYYSRGKYESFHSFGGECCLGIQVHKKIALGCNYIFNTAGGSRFLGVKLSCLF